MRIADQQDILEPHACVMILQPCPDVVRPGITGGSRNEMVVVLGRSFRHDVNGKPQRFLRGDVGRQVRGLALDRRRGQDHQVRRIRRRRFGVFGPGDRFGIGRFYLRIDHGRKDPAAPF